MKIEVQVYGMNENGGVTHAGTHSIGQVTRRAAVRIQRGWEKWRTEYLTAHPGDYPLRHTAPTVTMKIHPIGKPEDARLYFVGKVKPSRG